MQKPALTDASEVDGEPRKQYCKDEMWNVFHKGRSGKLCPMLLIGQRRGTQRHDHWMWQWRSLLNKNRFGELKVTMT